MKNPIIFSFLITYLFILSLLGAIIFGVCTLFIPTFEFQVLFIACFLTLILLVIWVTKQPDERKMK